MCFIGGFNILKLFFFPSGKNLSFLISQKQSFDMKIKIIFWFLFLHLEDMQQF